MFLDVLTCLLLIGHTFFVEAFSLFSSEPQIHSSHYPEILKLQNQINARRQQNSLQPTSFSPSLRFVEHMDDPSVVSSIQNAANQASGQIQSVSSNVANQLQSVSTNTANQIQAATNQIKTAVDAAGDKIKTTAETAGDKIKTTVETAGDKIKTTAETAGDKIKNTAQEIGNKAKELEENTKNKLINTEKELSAKFTSLENSMKHGFQDTSFHIPQNNPFLQWLPLILLVLILAVLAFLLYAFRKYIPACVHYTELTCEYFWRTIFFPFQVLYSILQFIFYPIKQCCIFSYRHCRDCYYPAAKKGPIHWDTTTSD